MDSKKRKHRTLPNGWARATIPELISKGGVFVDGDWVETKDQDPEGNVRLIQLADIGDGVFRNRSSRFLTKDRAEDLKCTFLLEGDVLIARMPDPIGRACIFPLKGENRFVTVVDVAVVRPGQGSVSNKYLKYTINSPDVRREIESLQSGTTRKRISRGNLATVKLPIPPLNEQQRIADSVEALFSELDNGIEQLTMAQKQLKVYRQAVLKWAFEGKLTNDNVVDGELPSGWAWKQLQTITSVLGDGLHGTPAYSANGDFYFINGNNLSDGKIILKEGTKRVTRVEYEKYKKELNENTILVSINGTLGNTAFYNNEKVILGKSACYFSVTSEVDKHYVRYLLTGQRFLSYADNTATGSTIQNVSLKSMREFQIPVPPTIKEQQAIVREIESRLSVCDKLEETITANLLQAESLRQSILKKAFEGKLVPQDPNNPPASELLEKIQGQKNGIRELKSAASRTAAKLHAV